MAGVTSLKIFEEGDNLYIEIAGDPTAKKKIKEGLSSLISGELVQEISGLLPKEEKKPELPNNWLDESIRLLTPKEEPQGENNQQDRDDWDDWGEPVEKQEEQAKAELETEEVTIIADDDDDW